jgi:hypothetical protein
MIKNVILFRGIRKDITQFTDALLGMTFKEMLYGEELVDFNQYDPSFDGVISESLGEKLKSTESSGLFRKPYEVIHFENFYEKSRYVFMLAYEDCFFKTYKHIETGSDSIFNIECELDKFISSNCFDTSKWSETGSIKLEAGDGICFRPWLWHSIQRKLVQVFYIEGIDG